MCLLIFAWQVEPSYPLVVAANRDEWYERPATSFCVLRESSPRMLGGRDELAGGTWLAANECGVVAGLTNRPSPGGRDPTKRTRGELPRLLAEQRSADGAVADLMEWVRPSDYNPAWLLVGDRDSLYYVELTASETPAVRQLDPGVHVLENVPLGTASPKIDRVCSLIATMSTAGSPLWPLLPSVLADHTVPSTNHEWTANSDTARSRATLIRVSLNPDDRPEMLVADGSPCTAPFVDVSRHWSGG